MSSVLGIMWCSQCIALLACRISRHSPVFPDDFGTATIGLSQVVGPSTFSIISDFSNHESSMGIFSLVWYGARLTGLEQWLGQCVVVIWNFWKVLSLEKLSNLSIISCVDGGMLSDGTLMVAVALDGPTRRRSRAIAVCFPSNDP